MLKSTHLKIAATCVVIVALSAGSAAAAPVAQRKTGSVPDSGTQSWLMQVWQFVERHLEVRFFVRGGAKSVGTDPWLQPRLDPGEIPARPATSACRRAMCE
jgi:hypothetical protein